MDTRDQDPYYLCTPDDRKRKNPTTLRIDDELRKIDTYVEQVLYYARSTDVEKDFKVEKTTLQSLVHAALKTYSKPLIQAGGKPVLNDLDIPIVADSKELHICNRTNHIQRDQIS